MRSPIPVNRGAVVWTLLMGMVSGVLVPDALARGGQKLHVNDKPMTVEQQRVFNDPPQSHLNAARYAARQDTLWWGGVDGSGLAVPGGTWDFEDGTLQGWTSTDLTDIPIRFRRITPADCTAHGDPVCPVITGQGGAASLWVGWHEDEATALCWPGGQGYGNSEGHHASKQFQYAGTGSVTLGYDYFVDSETGFDFTYVYVIDNNGIQSGPFNTCGNPNSNGFGYSGANVEGTEIGGNDVPASDQLIIDTTFLPDGEGPFEIGFTFDSDPLYSDALDSFGGFLNSLNGPFGVDNIQVTGINLNDLSDFEGGLDGWSMFRDPAIGTYTQVAALTDLDEVSVGCDCPLTATGNDYVMVAADISQLPPNFPHPKKQAEEMRSPPAYIEGIGGTDRFTLWSAFGDHPRSSGVGYRVVVHYYPWTCPETAVVGWTIEPAGEGGYFFFDPPDCDTFVQNHAQWLPAAVDSMKVVFSVLGDCDDFGVDPVSCIGPEQTNQSPYWDNVRLGIARTVNAPQLGVDTLYQDCYPRANSVIATEEARMYSFYDNNRSDGGDATNANMGDSAVVLAGNQDNSEVYMNYRAYPGVGMGPDGNNSQGDTFFSECGDANALTNGGGWAAARMDTAETASGLQTGLYATYHLEGSCGYTAPEQVVGPGGIMIPNKANKILPDDLFTPGSTVQYFFTSNFTGNVEQDVQPDTTGAFYYEVEVLPGYLTQSPVDPLYNLLTPCMLYVDAFNVGGQVPIQDFGLRPYLGTLIDVDGTEHDNWDRYDYQAASAGVPAPYAREVYGDNGATKYQSMIYRTVLWNTGRFSLEGLRDGDADLLLNFLTNDDFGRPDFQKGLWLSGNGMPNILNNSNRPYCLTLLHKYAGAQVRFNGLPYRDPGVSGDSSLCVRLDPATGRHFPTSGASYGSIRGNGCPTLLAFTVIGTIEDGVGNMEYVDQDGGEVVTQYASISNDRFAPTTYANYGLVIDAWSLHYLRSTPDGWTGDDCGADSSAITTRTADVLNWFQTTAQACDPSDPVTSTPGTEPATITPAQTTLFQNAPNPFNPRTTVRYQLAENAHVRVVVIDVSGKVVRTLVDGLQSPNTYSVTWDGITEGGTKVASGVYWVRMTTSRGFDAATKMVVLK